MSSDILRFAEQTLAIRYTDDEKKKIRSYIACYYVETVKSGGYESPYSKLRQLPEPGAPSRATRISLCL
jgi:hypothetical protein